MKKILMFLMMVVSMFLVTVSASDYPTIMEITEEKITYDTSVDSDMFGKIFATDGDYLVIGSGSMDEVFVRNQITGTIERTITPTDIQAGDGFGDSISILGDFILIGSPSDTNEKGDNCGAVYLYKLSDSTFERKIVPSDGADWHGFGGAVQVNSDYIVVGTNYAEAVYVYKISDDTYERKIVLTGGTTSDDFGQAITISDTHIVVSAERMTNNSVSSMGAVFVYSFTDTSYEVKLTPYNGLSYDSFGESISIDGNYILVGAPDVDEGSNSSVGRLYLYKIDGPNISLEREIMSSDRAHYDYFGRRVSIFGDYIVAAAHGDDDNGNYSGSVYLYKISDESFEEKIIASDGVTNDYYSFGSVLAYSDFIYVSSEESGIGDNRGAIYKYEITYSIVYPSIPLKETHHIDLEFNEVTVEMGSELVLPEIEAYKLYGYYKTDLTNDVITTGEYDLGEVGTYEITYTLTAYNEHEEVTDTIIETLTINVVDTTPPAVEVSDEEVRVVRTTDVDYLSYIEVEKGAVVEHTEIDSTKCGEQQINYTVTDKAGNITEVTVHVLVEVPITNIHLVHINEQQLVYIFDERVFDLASIEYKYMWSNEEPNSNNQGWMAISDVEKGEGVIYVMAIDKNGNAIIREAKNYFTKDKFTISTEEYIK